MTITWKNQWTTPAKVGVVSLAAGIGIGYIAARRKFDRDLDTALMVRDRLDADEIPFTHENVQIGTVTRVEGTEDGISVQGVITDPRMKEFVSPPMSGVSIAENPVRRTHVFPPRNPQADKDLGAQFAESVVKENEAVEPPVDAPIQKKNIWQEPEWDVSEEMANRTTDAPYTLHVNEWHNREKGYPQQPLTWYDGDKILADENHMVIYNVNDVTGKLEFGRGSRDPDTVYIRNDALRAEYEVTRVHDSYEHTVYGVQAEEQADQDDLRHSSSPRRFRQYRD